MAKPNPVLLSLAVVFALVVPNSVNKFLTSSSGIPTPWSITVICKKAFFSIILTDTFVSGFEYFIALHK